MGLLDTLLGRSKPVKANLDRLFALPAAAITLEASEQLVPTGQAGVCFKPAAGSDFANAESEIAQLLALDGAGSPAPGGDTPPASVRAALSEHADEYGYRWIVLEAADFDTLVTRAHFVNSTLDEHGWSSLLLCSVFGFGAMPAGSEHGAVASGPASTYLVYLYKQGSFYPFVPLAGERRDNEAELRLKAELKGDLAIEPDLDRWFPLWKLPLR